DEDGLVDLAGNDYLGLARHPEVVAAASRALKGYGLGATSSRLVRGSTEVDAELEAALAARLGCGAALVYSSGFLANLGAVRAVVYRHADPAALREALDGPGEGGVAITESVFSVYGDLAPLAALHAVVRDRGAVLMVDDAHALGLLGPDGGGAVRAAGLAGSPDVVRTATLSKAMGAAGGGVAGPAAFLEHLVDTSRRFIYDAGLPPAVAGGALAALHLIRGPYGEAARAELAERAGVAAARLRDAGLEVREPAGGVL